MASRIAQAPAVLDLWIAGTMHANSDAVERLRTHGITLDVARAEVLKLNAAGLSEPTRLNKDLLLKLFGPPVDSSEERLLYDLVLWPEHVYRWHLGSSGRAASDGGFRRRAKDKVDLPAEWDERLAKQAFRIWEHTDEDVIQGLGEAQDEKTWWPQTSLYFEVPKAGSRIVLTFDHGLLCDIAMEAPRT